MTSEVPGLHHPERGFSLIECLVATLLFTLSCLGVFSLYQQQIASTQALVQWHVAKEIASAKASDLQKQLTDPHSTIADINDDTGGELAAGRTTITREERDYNLQRHWQVTTVKSAGSTLKLASINIALSTSKRTADATQHVILWQSVPPLLLRFEDFNPDNGESPP